MESFAIETAAGTPPRYCLGACVITDAERYTSITECIDPASAVALINRYLETLFRPVYAHGGFISDVKGDGVLAVWTEGPSDAELRARVCRACLEMAGPAAPSHSPRPVHGLSTRVGAYVGPIALARVGALAHYEYRAVGDTVNTASRLEALNKLLGTRLLVSAELAKGLDEFLFRDLGEFGLRGKSRQVRVFELVAARASASPDQLQLCDAFAAALDAQRSDRRDAALAHWQELCTRYPEDVPSRYALQRCRYALAAQTRTPPANRKLASALPGFALAGSALET